MDVFYAQDLADVRGAAEGQVNGCAGVGGSSRIGSWLVEGAMESEILAGVAGMTTTSEGAGTGMGMPTAWKM